VDCHQTAANGCLPTLNFLSQLKRFHVFFGPSSVTASKKTDLFDAVAAGVWKKDWVVHCKPVGDGTSALKYLAPYIYRVALTNNRIEKQENGQVSFRFKNSNTDQWETEILSAFDFSHRFLQHVLRKGFVKIRYYGYGDASEALPEEKGEKQIGST
jgi:hypothetical protein